MDTGLVTITKQEYDELVAFKAASRVPLNVADVPSRSPFQNDPEVISFLAGKFGHVPMIELLEQCSSKFGWRRTPSASAAYRYWQKLRSERCCGS